MSWHPWETVPSLPSINTMLREGPDLPKCTVRQQEGRIKSMHFGHRRHTSDYSAPSACFSPQQKPYEPSPQVTPDTLPPLRLASPPTATAGIVSPAAMVTSSHHQPLPAMIMQPKLSFATEVPCVPITATAFPPVTFPSDATYQYHEDDVLTWHRHYHGRSYSDMTYHAQKQFDKNSPNRYLCPYCYKGFSRPSSLRTHTYSHTGEKPFVCPVDGCHRRFNVHSNLRRHIRRHQIPTTSIAIPSSPTTEDTNLSSPVCCRQ